MALPATRMPSPPFRSRRFRNGKRTSTAFEISQPRRSTRSIPFTPPTSKVKTPPATRSMPGSWAALAPIPSRPAPSSPTCARWRRTAAASPSIRRPSNSSATSQPAPMAKARLTIRQSPKAKSPGRIHSISTASGSFRPTLPGQATTRSRSNSFARWKPTPPAVSKISPPNMPSKITARRHPSKPITPSAQNRSPILKWASPSGWRATSRAAPAICNLLRPAKVQHNFPPSRINRRRRWPEQDTTTSLLPAGMTTKSYTVTLQNTSANTSNWYIPTLLAAQTGDAADWLVQVLLNGQDITGQTLDADGFTFNATTTALATAGLVLDPNTQQTLTFNFTPLNANAANDPYSPSSSPAHSGIPTPATPLRIGHVSIRPMSLRTLLGIPSIALVISRLRRRRASVLQSPSIRA